MGPAALFQPWIAGRLAGDGRQMLTMTANSASSPSAKGGRSTSMDGAKTNAARMQTHLRITDMCETWPELCCRCTPAPGQGSRSDAAAHTQLQGIWDGRAHAVQQSAPCQCAWDHTGVRRQLLQPSRQLRAAQGPTHAASQHCDSPKGAVHLRARQSEDLCTALGPKESCTQTCIGRLQQHAGSLYSPADVQHWSG